VSLPIGTWLGPYEVLGALGVGGMGEVYRARDTRLDRHVALKLLPETFAADPDRLLRFEREAKTLASLNHSNIAQIHGVEGSGLTRAIVMELVEGETLADLIARRPSGGIEVSEALDIRVECDAIKDGRCTVGIDPPKSNWAHPLDTPPFEAYAVTCGITFTFGGLRIIPDTGQVVDVNFHPIPGLYTAGEMLGGLFYFNYPAGTGLVSGAVFGRIAGTAAGRDTRGGTAS